MWLLCVPMAAHAMAWGNTQCRSGDASEIGPAADLALKRQRFCFPLQIVEQREDGVNVNNWHWYVLLWSPSLPKIVGRNMLMCTNIVDSMTSVRARG